MLCFEDLLVHCDVQRALPPESWRIRKLFSHPEPRRFLAAGQKFFYTGQFPKLCHPLGPCRRNTMWPAERPAGRVTAIRGDKMGREARPTGLLRIRTGAWPCRQRTLTSHLVPRCRVRPATKFLPTVTLVVVLSTNLPETAVSGAGDGMRLSTMVSAFLE